MKKKFYKKWWFWLIVVIVIAGAAGAGGNKKNNEDSKNVATTESKKKDDKKTNEKKEDSKVNYDSFMKIEMGSTYEDVVKILGEGKEESSSELSGVKSVIYGWTGSGISNMNITVQNNAVTGKAQAGLNNNKSDINLEKYNKVENGMDLKAVENILGEGSLSSKVKLMDVETSMYLWVNKDGTNANVTFQGDKVTMKSHFGLK